MIAFMPFRSRRSKAIRDARRYGALITDYNRQYVLLIGSVIVDSTPRGEALYKQRQGETLRDDVLTFTAENGEVLYYTSKEAQIEFKNFKGISWVFDDVTSLYQPKIDLDQKLEKLEDQLSLQQVFFDNVTAPIWIQNENGDIEFKNNEFDVYFTDNKVPKSIQTLALQAIRAKEFTIEEQTVIAKGARCHLHIKVKPFDTNKAIIWAPDRTELVEQINARNRLLNAQREMLEQIHTAVSLFDQNTHLTFYNSAFAHIWGLEESYLNTNPALSDILERLREMRVLPEQVDFKTYKNEWMNRFTQLLGPKEDMAYLPDGRTLRQLTIPNPEGGLFMIFEDVTDTLQLESSVNTLLEVQRETLDHMVEAMAVYGQDGRLQLWNPQYAQLWGLFPEDLKGKPHISSLIDTKIKAFDKNKHDEMKEKLVGDALNRDNNHGNFIFKDDRYIDYITVPLPDGATLLSYNDTTDAQKVRKALQDRADALETAEQLKMDFLSNMSYQLRNPLNSLLGFSELLEQQYFGALNETQVDYAQNITASGHELLKLIDEILDVATLEAGYMELKKDTVDVISMIDTIYHVTNEWARKSQHDYIKVIDIDDDVSINADERRLKQALINLIRNAINYTPRGGTIELGVKQDQDQLVFWVKDDGVGIPEKDQERVLKAFERLEDQVNGHDNNAVKSGAGLGLTLVQSIAELHDGAITIDSKEGKGTKISILMPL